MKKIHKYKIWFFEKKKTTKMIEKEKKKIIKLKKIENRINRKQKEEGEWEVSSSC